jgi:hypothetical protein
MKEEGEEKPFYDGKLISSSRTNVMNRRRDAYGCMTGRNGTVLKF